MCPTIHEIVQSYQTYLEVKHPQKHVVFNQRLKHDPEAGRAEAIVFALLRSQFDSAAVNEDLAKGGFDFRCGVDSLEVAVEVTSLKARTVESQSGFSSSEIETAQWFELLTPTLRTAISGKAGQLADFSGPRVLAIVSESLAASLVFGTYAAEDLLLGGTKISVPLNKPISETYTSTLLKNSVFFRFKDGVVVPCRQSISAILLISAFDSGLDCVGILHPEPAFRFHPTLLAGVPFLRIVNWPLNSTEIEVEWVVGNPKPGRLPLKQVTFTDHELKNR